VRLRNVAYEKSNETPEIQDDADVIVTRDNCQPTNPSYKCDLLNTPVVVSDKTFRFTTNATALNGATIKQYRYEFTGSNNYKAEAMTNKANGESEHSFPAAGNYTARVTVDFTVNGEVKSHTADSCAQAVNIGGPTTLPSTGPGDVAGIFAAVTVAGALAHRLVLSRRRFF
jgi:hypothetical protein